MITLTEYFNETLIRNVMNCNNLPDNETDYKLLMKKYLASKGKIKYKQIGKFGRFYASVGLQYFQKDIRKYLSNGVYTDIDIVNCHPNILLQLFEMNELSVPQFLIDYCNDRPSVIEKYKLKDKMTVIMIMFSDTLHKNYQNIPEIVEFHKSMYNDLLVKLKLKYKVKSDKFGNINGSILAKILQYVENDILQCMVIKSHELKMPAEVLVFDGFMVRKDTYSESNLKNIEEYVFKNLKLN
jgi:hypothetical protein